MKILLLAGGKSNERDVSIRSGKAVAKALSDLGYEYTLADPADESFDLESLVQGVDLVFPALHGEGGEDGVLQAELEKLGIKFVGSGSKASKLCWNKWEYKKLLLQQNLPASEGIIVNAKEDNNTAFDKPFVLKPIEGGSSLDTIIARNPDESKKLQAKTVLDNYGSMLLEPIIEGTEITVGVLDNETLPIVEIVPPEGLEFDYENKYNGATKELCPPVNVSQDVQSRAKDLALKIHNLCDCKDMSRTDIIIDSENNLHVLETNTIPGMTEQSLLPKMATTEGYAMTEFVDKLVKLASA